MPTLEFPCELNAPLEKVWAFYDTIDTLFQLTPPPTQVRLAGEAVPMRVGVVYSLRIKRFGLPLRWDAEIIAYDPPTAFVDRQVKGKGPFKAWQHAHLFAAIPGNRTRLTDRITYELPFGPLGRLADALFVRRELQKMFAYRHQVTRESVENSDAPTTRSHD